MIEDELRTLLRSRVAAPPHNPARPAEVRARITATKRRRVAAGALALILLALASLAVIRLPGTNESLPPGVPAPPYFTDSGVPEVPGYYRPDGADVGPEGLSFWGVGGESFDYLFVIRCGEPEDVTVRNVRGGDPVVVRCRTRVGDHREGALLVTPEQASVLFADPQDEPYNVKVERSSPGVPDLHLLKARAPKRLYWDPCCDAGYLVDGRKNPAGTTVDFTPSPPQSDDPQPGLQGFGLTVDCVAGVRLTFRVPQGELGSVACDPSASEDTYSNGSGALRVSADTMRRLGLDYDRRVRLTVVRTGTDTDQWRVAVPG